MFNRKIKHFKTNKRLAFLYIFFFNRLKIVVTQFFAILQFFSFFSQQIKNRGARFRQLRRVKKRHAFLGLCGKLALRLRFISEY